MLGMLWCVLSPTCKACCKFRPRAMAALCRDLLSAYLISWAQQQFPDKVRYHFDQQLDRITLEDKTASFLDGTCGQTAVHTYDLLIGADSANSR